MEVRIYSWNLLSTKLTSPGYHNHCQPEHLDTRNRQAIIFPRLALEMKEQAIICLQELSEYWLTQLLPIFEAAGYTFVYDSQWLGVGIAYPRRQYMMTTTVLESVGEELTKECIKYIPTRYDTLLSMGESVFRYLWNKLPRRLAKFRPAPEDMWQIATKRANRFIGVTLACLDGSPSFNTFCYHMPCEFRRNDVMNIHAAGLLNRIQRYSDTLPYILAGDFNSTPQSSVYNLITKALVPLFPFSKYYSKVPPLTTRHYVPLTSAYQGFHGKEPAFTNFGWTKDAPTAFCDTIDYIFCSPDFTPIQASLPIVSLQPETRSLPNGQEPSDHLPLKAIFTLKK